MKAKIGIDAGHGGSAFGTYGINTVNDGLFEKDYTLELALLLEKELLKNGFKVVMTRRDEKSPGGIAARAQKMIESGVDFALSLHFNGFGNEGANGTEVYVPHEEKIGFIEAGFCRCLGEYFKLRAPFTRSNSYYDRNRIFDKKLDLKSGKFGATCGEKDYFGFVRRCWEAGISADLLEICFLTNKKDFENYCANKEKIAKDLAKSIVEAFGEKYAEETMASKPGKVVFNTVNLPR